MADVNLRTRLLEERLTVEATRAREWRYIWAAINGLSAAAPLAAIPFTAREFRADLIAGSVSSAISTGLTLLWPLDVESAPTRVSSASGLAPCERLSVVMIVARSAADDEIARRAWTWHVLNFGVSAGLGAVLAFGFGHPMGGVITAVSGFAAGELQLVTQPVGLSREPQLNMGSFGLRPLWWASTAGSLSIVGASFQGHLP